jgi:uncharacterized protein (TIGR00255 family)
MIRSMTGFGEAQKDLTGGNLRVTVKTVNHRSFNAHLRTPTGFDRYEADIQNWLKGFFSRGHVNVSLTIDRDKGPDAKDLPELDLEMARHYAGLLRSLKGDLELAGEIELQSLLRFGDIFRAAEVKGADPGVDVEDLREVVEEAARGALEMREQEGERLEADLRERLKGMEVGMAAIEARAPARLVSERDRLQAAIRELSQQDEVDEERIAKEIAYLADRWDINEELVRFSAHVQAFRDALDGGEGAPVGKRLGFLVQEMHREANTVASKANDLEIGHASVSVREEIERLREQLENVE